jgi:hypothetical protein
MKNAMIAAAAAVLMFSVSARAEDSTWADPALSGAREAVSAAKAAQSKVEKQPILNLAIQRRWALEDERAKLNETIRKNNDEISTCVREIRVQCDRIGYVDLPATSMQAHFGFSLADVSDANIVGAIAKYPDIRIMDCGEIYPWGHVNKIAAAVAGRNEAQRRLKDISESLGEVDRTIDVYGKK